MPQWVSGVGLSSPDAKKSPETAFSLSSSGSDDRRLAMIESGSGMATEGLHLVATRGRLRDTSAPSRGSQSAGSLPPLEDGAPRDRSPRRKEAIMDAPERQYGALRSRDDRGKSPLPISDHWIPISGVTRTGGSSRDGSRQRSLLNVPADNDVDLEDTLGDDLAAEMTDDMASGSVLVSRSGSG